MPTTSTRWRRFYRRRFLNRARHHQGAHVIADVDVMRYDDGTRAVSADLHLADCRGCVRLDFDVFTRADAANALHKLRVLREVLDGFEPALLAAVDEADLAPRRR
jgi:hypothetical protein